MTKHLVGIPAVDLYDPVLPAVLQAVDNQHPRPDLVLIAVPPRSQDQRPFVTDFTSLPCEVLDAAQVGTASQRNAILDRATDYDIVHFVDSDVLLEPTYLSAMIRHFDNTELVGVSGTLSFPRRQPRNRPAAEQLLRRLALAAPPPGRISRAGVVSSSVHPTGGLHRTTWMSAGAMSIRMSVARRLRFPEELQRGPTGPYAMAEDVYFTLQLGRLGAMASAGDCRASHLGDESWKETDPAFWEMKVWSRMILARDYPEIVTPAAVRYAAACDLLAQSLLTSGKRRHAAQVGLARGLAKSVRSGKVPRIDGG